VESGGVLNIVAHPDDDLLFLSPALLTSLRAGMAVRTVFLTAGDDGRAQPYWKGREAGIRAAYSRMAGVEDVWHSAPTPEPAQLSVLTGAPQVSLQFFRLPDGGPGRGFPRYAYQSLPQLWRGQRPSIQAVDGSVRYTRAALIDTLVGVIEHASAHTIRTQDFHGRFGDGDHNDHHAAAFLTRAASTRTRSPHWLESYQDYSISGRPADVVGKQLRDKESAFAAYAAHDRLVCTGGTSPCGHSFISWQRRQYRESRQWIS
jgi:LmbE family N-acetylglucosaminyl deacetylase